MADGLPISALLADHYSNVRLSTDHRVIQADDYKRHPFTCVDVEKRSFFKNLGLKMKQEERLQERSGILMQPLASRVAIVTSNVHALPFSSPSMLCMVKFAGELVSDMSALVRSQQTRMFRSTLWPSASTKKLVLQSPQQPLPSSDADFANMAWVSKRKRLAEIEKKRKQKRDLVASDREDKRKKLIERLKQYSEKERRSILPNLYRPAQVEVERLESSKCTRCPNLVFNVEGQRWHTCIAR